MGETNDKKVVKKKLIGFDADMLSALEEKKNAGYGKDETDILRKLLVGEKHFLPEVESYISEQQSHSGLSRDTVLQILIIEALQMKEPRFRILSSSAHRRNDSAQHHPNVNGVVPPNPRASRRVHKSPPEKAQ